jgi:ubiquinone/menaquinone biosynthesis C-methylase UbiE
MDLGELEQTWTKLGETDPLWAVLSLPELRYNNWDVEEFFRTADTEIGETWQYLTELGVPTSGASCLDFGCGVGRCARALSAHYSEYDGVDISEPMLKLARTYNDSPHVRFHHNQSDDLALFPDDTFDFIYSRFVLQHIPPESSAHYISEFIRVLKPGGTALFQVPAATKDISLPSYRARLTMVESPAPKRLLRRAVSIAASGSSTWTLRVDNVSGVTWPTESVSLGNHWLTPGADMVRMNDGRARLTADLCGGDHEVLAIRVNHPSRPGRYVLEFDMVQEGVTWFTDQGSVVLRVPVLVTKAAGVPSPDAQFDGADAERTGRPAPASAAESGAEEEPPSFDMHVLERARVESLVAAAGGRMIAVTENLNCGPLWVSYLYAATKD